MVRISSAPDACGQEHNAKTAKHLRILLLARRTRERGGREVCLGVVDFDCVGHVDAAKQLHSAHPDRVLRSVTPRRGVASLSLRCRALPLQAGNNQSRAESAPQTVRSSHSWSPRFDGRAHWSA